MASKGPCTITYHIINSTILGAIRAATLVKRHYRHRSYLAVYLGIRPSYYSYSSTMHFLPALIYFIYPCSNQWMVVLRPSIDLAKRCVVLLVTLVLISLIIVVMISDRFEDRRTIAEQTSNNCC